MITKLSLQKIKISLRIILLCITTFLQIHSVLAINEKIRSDTCVPLPINALEIKYDAYHYLLEHIRMSSLAVDDKNGKPFTPCDPNDQNFSFGFAMDQGMLESTTMTLNTTKELSKISAHPKLGGDPVLGKIKLSVKQIRNNMCLTMPTVIGDRPLVCKATPRPIQETPEIPQNNKIAHVCYTSNDSQSLFSFSGNAVSCVQQTIGSLFQGDANIVLQRLAGFHTFQESMRGTVLVIVALYIILYGIRIMNSGQMHSRTFWELILKTVFVLYFSGALYSFNENKRANPIADLFLPLLQSSMMGFIQIIEGALDTNGMCVFNKDKYAENKKHYAIWDRIDCRIAMYLGSVESYNINVDSKLIPTMTHTEVGKDTGFKPFKLPHADASLFKLVNTLPYLIGQFFGVNERESDFRGASGLFSYAEHIILFAFFSPLIVVFIIVLMHIVTRALTHYMVCSVTIFALAYLAPIFIPTILFSETKRYFDGWLRVLISCTLQPMVVIGLVVILFSIYDQILFGTCLFQRVDYRNNIGRNISLFELRVPEINADQCTSSLGYTALKVYVTGNGWEDLLSYDPLYIIIAGLVCHRLFYHIFGFAAQLTLGPTVRIPELAKTPKNKRNTGDKGQQDLYAMGDKEQQDLYAMGDKEQQDLYAMGDKEQQDLYAMGDKEQQDLYEKGYEKRQGLNIQGDEEQQDLCYEKRQGLNIQGDEEQQDLYSQNVEANRESHSNADADHTHNVEGRSEQSNNLNLQNANSKDMEDANRNKNQEVSRRTDGNKINQQNIQNQEGLKQDDAQIKGALTNFANQQQNIQQNNIKNDLSQNQQDPLPNTSANQIQPKNENAVRTDNLNLLEQMQNIKQEKE
ncbi:TrbL/VirB6 family protein [Candidatus Sarmatiella mevalonica]|uniref:type IV secretion system protein n=1 Tax=Candidatus Sarmatiella mevalonica TaxID=2770581 RepID=UPI001922364A|nr:type IV secretion system protein [Candidatus Sarmatiella mevalonica]